MASKDKEIEITIDLDGTIHMDALNFEGKGCDEALEKIRRRVGKTKESKKKVEYHRRKEREPQKERS